MVDQNLIIYQLPTLYQILKELDQDLNFNIIEAKNEKFLKNSIIELKSYLLITKKKFVEIDNQLLFDFKPIKILKLIEKINVQFLKKNFNSQSEIIVNDYTIDLNSREILKKDNRLKLTEKEVNTIIYLSKMNKPVKIHELEKNVWKYQSDIETHTVETHIYRLRKKILEIFEDDKFIVSKKNGYQIK